MLILHWPYSTRHIICILSEESGCVSSASHGARAQLCFAFLHACAAARVLLSDCHVDIEVLCLAVKCQMFGNTGAWSSQSPINKRHLLKFGAGTVVVGAGAVAYRHRERISSIRIPWNSTVIEAAAGAAGEVAQMALLYPLDTVKVRCQAGGLSSRKALANLYSSTGGNWQAIFAALYAGILPGMALSVIVGSVHYACFCATRRALGRLAAAAGDRDTCNKIQQLDDSLSSSQSAHVIVSHGATGTHFIPIEDYTEEQDRQQHTDTAPSSNTPSTNQQGGSDSREAAAVARSSDAAESGSSPDAHEGSVGVNIAAAVITAALTAVFEAPLELFRHNSQAGQIQGNFVREMWKALRRSGPRALYYGMVPYCLESWPYDISELAVVGAAKDLRSSKSSSSSWSKARNMQWDLATGAVGGTVAVLVSMPFDVIKTYMQTHGTGMDAVGLRAGAAAFCDTGRQLVARGGLGALFVGLAPRLAHQVPGAMVCWLVVGTSHDWLVKTAERQQSEAAAAAAVSPPPPAAAAATDRR